ncbi:MAG: hypothetical protein ACLUEV_00870 [Alistipes sp.]
MMVKRGLIKPVEPAADSVARQRRSYRRRNDRSTRYFQPTPATRFLPSGVTNAAPVPASVI